MATRNSKLALGVGAAVLAGLALVYALRSQPGFTTGLHPIDGERAVFTMRHNPSDGKSRAWIGVLGPEGVQWSRELPDLTYSSYSRHGLTVDDGLVTVRISDENTYAQVLAFDTSNGEPRWSGDKLAFAPSDNDMVLPIVMGARPFADSGQVLQPEHNRDEGGLVMRSADDGAVTWRLPLASYPVVGMARTDQHLAYRTVDGWVVVNRTDGSEVVRVDMYGAACLERGRLSLWANGTLRIVDLTQADPEAIERALPTPGVTWTCGTHNGKLVFTVGRDNGEGGDQFEVVGVDPERAEIDWRIDLDGWGPSVSARVGDNASPAADPLRGQISDFAPLLLGRRGRDDVKLAVLDLRAHTIAWESRPRPELLHYQVLRGSGDQHFLDGNSDLVAIDGSTGELTAAVKLVHERIRSFYAVDGRLWVYAFGYATLDTLPYLLLDGQALTPVTTPQGEYAPTENLAAVQSWLR